MVDWQLTATTIYCEAVEDEVTVMVYKDGTVKCTGGKKYGEPTKQFAKAIQAKARELKRQIKCEGPACRRVTDYRDKLFAGEAEK